jgi:hypothetical protein
VQTVGRKAAALSQVAARTSIRGTLGGSNGDEQ